MTTVASKAVVYQFGVQYQTIGAAIPRQATAPRAQIARRTDSFVVSSFV
jgi:hypothetical protein